MPDLVIPAAIPAAPFVGTRKLVLTAAADQTTPVKMRFSRGITVIAAVVTVSRTGTPTQGHVEATLADVELRVESPDLRLTRDVSDDNDSDAFADATAVAFPAKYTFATLTGSPDVIIQARWKSPDHANLFNDCIVTVSLQYRWEN